MPETPNNGPTHGRFRKTMNSLYGDARKADAFPLGPSEQIAHGMQRRNLWLSHQVSQASLKMQAKMVKAQYRYGKQGLVGEGRAALSDVGGEMADRGIVGSSVHQAGREEVKAGVQSGIGEMRMQRDQELMNVNMQRLQGATDLRLGLGDLALQKAAQQRQMALAAFASGGRNPWGYA